MKPSTLLLITGAGLLVAHRLTRPAPVNGVGDLGSLRKKFKKAVKGAGGGITKGLKIVKRAGQTTAAIAQKYDPGTKLVLKAADQAAKIAPKPLRKIVAKVSVGGRRIGAPGGPPASTPQQEVEYQDENGNPISAAEYNRRIAEMEQQARLYKGGPAEVPSLPAQLYAPYSGGGSASAPAAEPSLLPPATATPAPSVVDTAAPAKKSNPLLAIAAFAAVPVVMGLTGEK